MIEDLNEEILRRIEIMDDPNYEPVPPLTRTDHIAIIVIAVVCIIGLFAGYYLG